MFTSKQGREVKRLIKAECANYVDGDCIILDCNCPQMISEHIICNYFKNNVLPLDLELSQELTGNGFAKRCNKCQKKFVSKSRTNQYCDFCSKVVTREKARERQKKQRS